jgi:hypothetical protein
MLVSTIPKEFIFIVVFKRFFGWRWLCAKLISQLPVPCKEDLSMTPASGKPILLYCDMARVQKVLHAPLGE